MLKNKAPKYCKGCYVSESGICTKCMNKKNKAEMMSLNFFKSKKSSITKKRGKRKDLTHTSLKTDMQLIVRLLGGDNCITCGKQFDAGRHLHQGGHFKGRSKASTAFLIENISKQCAYCNNPKCGDGEVFLHSKYLDNYWGAGTAGKIDKMSKIVYPFTTDILTDLRDKINEWKKNAKTVIDKDGLKQEIKKWQENQFWYQEILKQTI